MKIARLFIAVAGFLAPWILMILVILMSPGSSGHLHYARTVIRTIGTESVHMYDRAAETMAELGERRDPRLDAWHRDLFRSAGMSSMLNGRFSDATRFFDRIAEDSVQPGGGRMVDYFALINRGICRYKMADIGGAQADWRTAQEAFPGRHDGYLVTGHSRLLGGDEAGARRDYTRALEIAGLLGIVYADIGDAWLYTGNMAEAEKMYRNGLASDPADVFCRLRLGQLALIRDNDPARALQEAAIIRRIMPTLRVVQDLESAARNWVPGTPMRHIPAARFEPGPARTWKLSPTKLYFEFFREEWRGWD